MTPPEAFIIGLGQNIRAGFESKKLRKPEYLPGIIPPDALQDSLNLTKDTVSTLLQIKQKRSAMSQQENKPFQWTDELVKDYISAIVSEWVLSGKFAHKMKEFKASRSSSEKVEKDWEIESYIFSPMLKQEILVRKGDKYWNLANYEKSPEFAIHSVRRLSDGEVFSIGDKMTYPDVYGTWGDGCKYCTIIHFSIHKEQLYVNNHYYADDQKTIKDWIKAPIPEEKPVLFTTEDGKEVFSDDTFSVWKVDPNFQLLTFAACDCSPQAHQTSKYFSTREAANEFVRRNKPVLSIKDIEDHMQKDIQEYRFVVVDFFWLKELARIRTKGGKD